MHGFSDIEKRLEILFELEKYEEVLALAYENLQNVEINQELLYQYTILSHLNLQEYTKSLEMCNEALGTYPSEAVFLYFKSKAYGYMDAYKKALEESQKALEIEPNEPRYLAQHAKILFIQDKTAQAKELIEKALEVDATNSEYHLLHARILYYIGDDKKIARGIVEDILAIEPHNEEALEIKQKYFTSKLKEKKSILKNLLFINPFSEESQKDIKFIKFYYRYIPFLMGVVILISYLLQSHRHQFSFLEPVAFISFAIVATIGSNDWRFNLPFIATIIGFDAYFNLGSRGIDFGEIFYILFMATIFQFVFIGVFLLFKGLKYSLSVKLQQQKNNQRNPLLFFLFLAPFEKHEEIDYKAMYNYYTRVPLLMLFSLVLIYFYIFYVQEFYFKIVLIVLFSVVATMSARNLLFTWIYLLSVLVLINRFECNGIFSCMFTALFLSLVFPMLYNFIRSMKWMKN